MSSNVTRKPASFTSIKPASFSILSNTTYTKRNSTAFSEEIVVTDLEENKNRTLLYLSEYETAHIHSKPAVTATVYRNGVDYEEGGELFIRGCNREDSVYFDGMEDLDRTSDPLMVVDLSLKSKVTEILQENPWLASKIVKKRNKHAIQFPTVLTQEEAKNRAEKVVRVATTRTPCRKNYSTTTKEIAASYAPSALKLLISDPITENTYDYIVEIVGPMIEKSRKSLWNVVLIPLTVASTTQPSDKFLLVHSLHPSLGDPSTLYKIYSMLVSDTPVESLDPKRIGTIEKLKEKLLGEDPNYMRSTAMQAGKGYRFTRAAKFTPNRTSMWTINQDKINSIKQVYDDEATCWDESLRSINTSKTDEPWVPLVSTNDILTSWFFSQNRDAAIGCLIADIRCKKSEVLSDMAGNYQTEVIYDTRRGETSTPAWIRASVMREDEILKRRSERELPGTKTLVAGPGASIVSNWSAICSKGIFNEVFLPHPAGVVELEPVCHFPIILDHNSSMSNKIGWNSLVVFRYSEEKIGALVMAPPSATDRNAANFLDRPTLFSDS